MTGFTQQQVSERAGFSQSYLSQVECGFRPISKRALERLEIVYKCRLGDLWQGAGRRGRRPLAPPARKALQQIGMTQCAFWENAQPDELVRATPHQVRRSDDPLALMSLRMGQSAYMEVQNLESKRAQDEIFWRNFNSISMQSWSQRRLLVRVALESMELTGLNLQSRGCRVELVDGKNGRTAGRQRTFVLSQNSTTILWSPQITVRTARGYRCLDNLLIYHAEGRQITLAVDVDESRFHGASNAHRDRELGIPVLHLGAREVDEIDVLDRIWKWAHDRWMQAGETPTSAG